MVGNWPASANSGYYNLDSRVKPGASPEKKHARSACT